jgi:hypothetical protein
MNPKVKKVLDKINNEGIDSVLPFFNDNFEKLLDYLKWGGAIEELRLDDSDLMNDFYLYLINNGYENKAMTEITRSMGSLSHDGENYYYELRFLDDMAEWFSTRGRDISPRDIAEGVFKEDYWEPFDFYRGDINLMTEVYDDLDKENQSFLKDYIIKNYGEEYAQLDDEEKMNEFFDDELSDVGDKLMDIYRVSYNDAYVNEYYYKVWGELKGEFIDIDAKPIEFKYGSGYYTKLKITDVLPRLIKQYVNNARCYDIDSLGDYSYLIREGIGCGAFELLTFRIGDYPDYREMKRVLNENFKEYF